MVQIQNHQLQQATRRSGVQRAAAAAAAAAVADAHRICSAPKGEASSDSSEARSGSFESILDESATGGGMDPKEPVRVDAVTIHSPSRAVPVQRSMVMAN
ncbi:hypothetical protein Pcac1_g22653 [Phytophthora cactorum]|nr:hypothetical protein Pcac1_g22653 [Phytophthora cactorum]